MKQINPILLSLFVLISLKTTASDTLKISINDLAFATPYEKKMFESTGKSAIDYLGLALATDSNTNADFRKGVENKLNELVASIESKINRKKPLDKNVKIIYNAVHEAFLKKYELQVSFHRIFQDGAYNCVTGTILYALIFEKLHIPYQIHETYNHVFLIAEPEKEKIYIESTDPAKGYYTISNEKKKDIIQLLIQAKLISEEQLKSTSEQALIDRYFNENRNINLLQLIGLQYYNQGIAYNALYDRERTIESLKKSYFLYPSLKTMALLGTSVINIFLNRPVGNATYNGAYKLLLQLTNDNAMELKGEIFSKIADDYSEKNDDLLGLKKYYESIMALDLDSDTKHLLQIIFFEANYINYNYKNDEIKSLLNLEQLLTLEPKNVKFKSALDKQINYIHLYSHKHSFGKSDSINDILERLSPYTENTKVKAIPFHKLFSKISHAVDFKKWEEAEKLVTEVETLYANTKPNVDIDRTMAHIYTYFSYILKREDNYAEARKWLKRGMKIMPDNATLTKAYNEAKTN